MKNIWLLLDGRPGNDAQTLGLISRLEVNYQIKHITYNWLALLPNFLIGKTKFHIDKKSKLEISPPYPDLVIATGRRLAPVSLYIKKISPNTKIIHIMNPEIYIKEFDLVILPKHDRKSGANIINIIGALHKVNSKILDEAREAFKELIKDLPKPYITVLVGGSLKNKVSDSDINIFIKYLNNIQKETNGSFLVTTSRRTNPKIKEAILQNLNFPRYIYDYNTSEKNPYMGFLSLADIITTTGDSISMASEALYTGKPLYIFTNNSFCKEKHLKFHGEIFNLNLAVDLKNFNKASKPDPEALDEGLGVANFIKEKFFK